MKVTIYSLLLVLLIACGSKKKKESAAAQLPRQSVIKVDGYLVQGQSFSENIEVPGSVIANEVTEVRPEVSGRIIQLNVAEGRYVKKGTLLAKLYDADLQAQLRKLQIQLSIAQKTEERQGQLLKIQGISQQDYDLSLLDVNSLRADIDIIRTEISRTEVRAPYNGRLGLKNISPGAYVSPTSIIAVINQTEQLKLDFTVPEKYTGKIEVGQIVSFTRDGSDKMYTARVSATELSVTETTRSLMVRSVVEKKDDNLLPGAFAKVRLNFNADSNAILIPTQAVLPQARGKKVIVYKNGIASFVDVETGIRDSSRIQIVSGLKVNDTIVVTGLLSVRPEAKIQIGNIINNKKQ